MTTWQAVMQADHQRAHSPKSVLNHATDTISQEMSSNRAAPHSATPTKAVGDALRLLRAAWDWLQQRRAEQLTSRRLRVAETISLGEKRFVSIVQVDGAQYLIGGSASSVQLLAVLDQAHTAGESQAVAVSR